MTQQFLNHFRILAVGIQDRAERMCADRLRTFRSSISVDEEWSCESSVHGQNVRLVTNIMLSRKELSLALKSIRDIPLLSRAYRVAVLFNPVLSDDRPY